MHSNPSFRKTARTAAITFARDRSFGTLIVCTASSPKGEAPRVAPLLAHIPFLLNRDGTEAHLHLARANPIARACTSATGPVDAILAVTGPDGYVSPDWYGMDDQVPTWNYVAVHLKGSLHPLPPETLPDTLAAQSAAFEQFIPDKAPWTMQKMTQDTTGRFLRMILPFRLEVAAVDSTFKLNQNKPDAARQRAACHVQEGFGSELGQLADLMRSPPPGA